MSYRTEMLEVAQEIRDKINQIDFANDPDCFVKRDKWHRQAEVIEFVATHPEGIAEIFKEQEESEKNQ